jgi:hypothetical protein
MRDEQTILLFNSRTTPILTKTRQKLDKTRPNHFNQLDNHISYSHSARSFLQHISLTIVVKSLTTTLQHSPLLSSNFLPEVRPYPNRTQPSWTTPTSRFAYAPTLRLTYNLNFRPTCRLVAGRVPAPLCYLPQPSQRTPICS